MISASQITQTHNAAEAALGVSKRPGRAVLTAHELASQRDAQDAGAANTWLIMLLVAAAAMRTLLFLLGPLSDPQRAMHDGSAAHIELAQRLASEGLFSVGAIRPEDPAAGYALLLMALSSVDAPTAALLGLQVVASIACVFLTFRLGHLLFRSRWVGLAGAAVLALHPSSIVASLTVMPETLLALLLLAGLTCALSSQRDFAGSLIAGLLVGLSTLVSPVMLAVGPLTGAWLALAGRRLGAIACAAVFTAASLVPAGLWAARNRLVGVDTAAGLAGYDLPIRTETLSALAGLRLPTGEPIHIAALDVLTANSTTQMLGRLGLSGPRDLDTAPIAMALSSRLPTLAELSDPATAFSLVWSLMNGLLLLAAVVGLLLLVLRGWWVTLLLPVAIVAYAVIGYPGGDPERWRVPVLAVEALLAGSLLLPLPRPSLRKWFARKPRPVMEDDEPVRPMPQREGLAARPL